MDLLTLKTGDVCQFSFIKSFHCIKHDIVETSFMLKMVVESIFEVFCGVEEKLPFALIAATAAQKNNLRIYPVFVRVWILLSSKDFSKTGDE